ncbi:hypothetical protein KCP74_20115 [Salmonella enterica subsp. enterica]|nr:hypothetical protein KCP74_20115 [Salmonella enterica subsp. enterica]
MRLPPFLAVSRRRASRCLPSFCGRRTAALRRRCMRLPVWLMPPLRLHSLPPWRFPPPDLLMSAPVQDACPATVRHIPRCLRCPAATSSTIALKTPQQRPPGGRRFVMAPRKSSFRCPALNHRRPYNSGM